MDNKLTKNTYFISQRTFDERKVFSSSVLCIQLLQLMKAAKSRIYHSHHELRPKVYAFPRVSILSYCVLPSRYVCLLREESSGGIESFTKLVHTGIDHYYRNLFKTSVPVFQEKRIKTHILDRNELHAATRYIHTLPALGCYVRDSHIMKYYPWSSYKEIVEQSECGVCDAKQLLNYYTSINHYKRSIQKVPM